MNKEQQELLDEAYVNYSMSYKDGHEFYEDEIIKRSYTKEEFINKCKNEDALSIKWRQEYKNLQYGSKEEIEHLSKYYKTDTEFSEKWGLTIEERELSLEERQNLYFKLNPEFRLVHEDMDKHMDKHNIPTKLITITYNDKTIESYE
jgi:hypothetical protein